MKGKVKAKDRRVVIFSVIILIVLISVIGVFFLPGVIKANALRNRVIDRLESVGDSDVVVLYDPLYRDGYMTTGAEKILEDEARKEVLKKTVYYLEKSGFSSAKRKDMGNWDLSLNVRNNDKVSVYFLNDSLYISDDYDVYIFSVKESNINDYAEFYAFLEDSLSTN